MIRWSGLALVGLGTLHLLVLGIDAVDEVPGWLRLEQWTTAHLQPFARQPPELAASGAAFWSTIGSCALPLIVLGALVVDLDRRGQAIPAFVGWALAAWMLLGALIVEPSGFPVGLVIALCLLVGIRRQRTSKRSAA